MDDRKRAEFVRLVRDSVGEATPTEDLPRRGQKMSIKGNGNTAVIATGGVVHIHQRPRVIARISPGDIHISHQQAARLKLLVTAAVRATGTSHQAVWSALHECMVVPQYRLIPAAAYPDAVAQLERWIQMGRLNE